MRVYSQNRENLKRYPDPARLPGRRTRCSRAHFRADIILTASDELRRYEAGEIGFLAVPEDPEFLSSGERERRGCW